MSNPGTGRSEDRFAGRRRSGATETPDISGDPGVGGLLADPEAQVLPRKDQSNPTGAVSPEPTPPTAHGDWLPTHRWHGRARR